MLHVIASLIVHSYKIRRIVFEIYIVYISMSLRGLRWMNVIIRQSRAAGNSKQARITK